MANNNSFGVNHDKIMFVINNIYRSCENLNGVKLSFDELIQDFHKNCDDTFGLKFANSLDELSLKYELVVKNIMSFAEDFSRINVLTENIDAELQIDIKRHIAKLESENYIEEYK